MVVLCIMLPLLRDLFLYFALAVGGSLNNYVLDCDISAQLCEKHNAHFMSVQITV